jgi:ATP-dependent DNA helicase RecG
MDRLHHILELLERPIHFASRDGGAHLSTVKNLGPFVSDKVVEALSNDVYLPVIETDLLALRQLFVDFDDRTAVERKRRLSVARAILQRLRQPPAKDEGGGARPAAPPQELWNIPIRFARGVGPKRAVLLEKLGIQTIEDALWFLPRRYEDRSALTPMNQLTPGSHATVCGVIQRSELKRTSRRGLAIVQLTVEDASGAVNAVYFNQPYLADTLTSGRRVMLSGPVSAGRQGWTDLRMDSPQYELLDDKGDVEGDAGTGSYDDLLHVGRIVPIYPETRGLTSRQIRMLQKGLLDQFLSGLEEVLPAGVRARRQLVPVQTAMSEVHFPSPGSDLHLLDRHVSPNHRRLAFEELFVLQMALAIQKQAVQNETKGIRFRPDSRLLERLRRQLPFELTKAQQRVLEDIRRDMEAPRPMHRLIQGDVGCGKTVVALHAMVMACGSGYQAAFMAPTEILAEQHYLNLRGLLETLGLKAVLLKSRAASKRATAHDALLEQIASGEAQIVIGTHALIQKGVRFGRLGLAVVDEQHKFGVLQRKTLLEKGYHPDVLVMTATPIPRTLAMTVYGDLDMSVIDALPPGRSAIRTRLVDESQRRRAYQALLDEVRRGRQGYIVYPLVEESEKVDLRAATQAAERFQKEFKLARIGLLHGRMKSEEKEAVMAAFKSREIQVLVTTTVIEVGVDVPNATVMLIEHAERFGLAQLHQLRGRIGRGSIESHCFLLPSPKALGKGLLSPAHLRLQALVNSTDGFAIAEEDLSIRGPGEFFGVRQWGLPELHVADLIRDAALLQEARDEAFRLLASDPTLKAPVHRPLREAMLRRWQGKVELAAIG